MKRNGSMRRLAFLAAAGLLILPAAGPRAAHALSMAEMADASRVFSDMSQKILQAAAGARERTDQANAEMNVLDRGWPGTPPQTREAIGRIESHLQAARERLQDAKQRMSRLSAHYQGGLAKSRKGRRAPSPVETEEDKFVLARYNEAYREAGDRAERSYEQALYALRQAEERLLTLKKKAAGIPPGN